MNCVWAVKFQQESSTPWHSEQIAGVRTFLKQAPCFPRTGASFRANLRSFHVELKQISEIFGYPFEIYYPDTGFG